MTNQHRVESFEDRVDILFDELELAVKWHRPSILLAIYASEFVRADAEAALAEKLRALEQKTEHYRVTGAENADIPLNLIQHPAIAHTVFFVSGVQWGDGTDGLNAYRALNIRREYFVDYRIRAVFWLTEREAMMLPRHAPDFWAFRHRVVEFVEAPALERMAPMAYKLAWHDLDDRTAREDTAAKIALREALLADLPESEETLSARAELLYTLAGLYWAKKEYEKSIGLGQRALIVAEQLANTRLQSACYNGLGNVYADLGKCDAALAAYHRAIELDPQYTTPHNGLGTVYAALGKYDAALAAYHRAIELAPQYATPHNGLGTVYRALGNYDAALAAYHRAIELDPQLAYPHNGLGTVYRALGNYDAALAAYHRAIELAPQYATPHNGLGNVYRALGKYEEALAAYHRAIELDPQLVYPYYNLARLEAVRGNIQKSLDYLEKAIALDARWKEYARETKEFAEMHGDARFRELVGG